MQIWQMIVLRNWSSTSSLPWRTCFSALDSSFFRFDDWTSSSFQPILDLSSTCGTLRMSSWLVHEATSLAPLPI